MPLIGQIVDICLHFPNLEPLPDAVDRSDHSYSLVRCRSRAVSNAADLP